MSTKGSNHRHLNRDDKRLTENWSKIDFKAKNEKQAKEIQLGIGKKRITYGK